MKRIHARLAAGAVGVLLATTACGGSYSGGGGGGGGGDVDPLTLLLALALIPLALTLRRVRS